MSKKPKIFISYSHEDEEWKEFIRKFFESANSFEMWDDRDIPLGEKWLDEIEQALGACNIAVLLISTHFLTSEFIKNKEVPLFLKRCEEENLKIVPIIISPCPWRKHDWLESIRGYPKDNKPLNSFQEIKHIKFDKCPKIQEEVNNLTNRILEEYEDKVTIANHSPEKENLINKLVKFLNDESIKLQELKDISKKFLEKIYHSKLNEINTLNGLIVYLDGIIIDDYQPLTCVIKSIYQEKKLHNSEIKSWLDKNHNENFCEKSKQNVEPLQARIILDFEKSENSNRVDLSIRYFENGRFVSNEGKYFHDDDINSKEFHKKVLDKIYDELYKYDHVDILLPQPFLLSDVKQWNYQDEENYIDICLTDNCCVNIHMRERAFLKSNKIKEMWESVVDQLEKPLKESMKDMTTPKEKVTKDTREVGLKYRFLPKSERNFSDRIKQKMITLRCGDPKKLEEFNQWLDNNKDLKLRQLKEEVDKSENAHMTIMWNDPSIPLKGDGIDAK